MEEVFILNYCEERGVPKDTRALLGSLGEDDLLALRVVIENLSPSSNALRSILSLMGDIRHRDGLNFNQILEKVSFSETIKRGGSTKDKLVKFKLSLERIRYPERFSIEDKLQDLASQILTKFGLRISFPPELEGDQLKITFPFKSADELKNVNSRISDLAQGQELEEIFKVLKGEI